MTPIVAPQLRQLAAVTINVAQIATADTVGTARVVPVVMAVKGHTVAIAVVMKV